MFLGAVNPARKTCVQQGGRFIRGKCFMPQVDNPFTPVAAGEVIEPAASDAPGSASLEESGSPLYLNKWLWVGAAVVAAALVFSSKRAPAKGESDNV